MQGTTHVVPFGDLNQVQEQPAELHAALVPQLERARCTMAPGQGSLAGSYRVHAEPMRGVTARVAGLQ